MELTVSAVEISKEDQLAVEPSINQLIETHGKSRTEISKLTTECVALSTASQSRAQALVNQGTVGRFWGGLTGKNQKLQAANMRDLALAQYAAQQTVIRLAEQNNMTMEIAVIIGNRVNMLSSNLIGTQNEITEVWTSIQALAKATKAKIVEVNDRVKNLERNDDLFYWKETLSERSLDGVDYCELNPVQKLTCLVTDFYTVSGGSWNFKDLLFFKSVIRELGLDPKLQITPLVFFEELCANQTLRMKFINIADINDRALESPLHAPIMAGVDKLQMLEREERYLVDTVEDMIKVQAENVNRDNIAMNLVGRHLDNAALFNINVGIPSYDFALELLSGIDVLKNSPAKGALLATELDERDQQVIELQGSLSTLKDKEGTLKKQVADNLALQEKEKRDLVARMESLEDKRTPIYFRGSAEDSCFAAIMNTGLVSLQNHLSWEKNHCDQVKSGDVLAEMRGPGISSTKEQPKILAERNGTLFILIDPNRGRGGVFNYTDFSHENLIGVISEDYDNTDAILAWVDDFDLWLDPEENSSSSKLMANLLDK